MVAVSFPSRRRDRENPAYLKNRTAGNGIPSSISCLSLQPGKNIRTAKPPRTLRKSNNYQEKVFNPKGLNLPSF
jgi:hypothetical protein